jgi:hypothetical protein
MQTRTTIHSDRADMKDLPQTETPTFLGSDFDDLELPRFICRCGKSPDGCPDDRAKSSDTTVPDEVKTNHKFPP